MNEGVCDISRWVSIGANASHSSLYTLNFLFSGKAKGGELVSKSLCPLDSTHQWVGVMCWRQWVLPLLWPFGLFLLRLREVTFHSQFSCSEPDFVSLSQHFKPVIWALHAQWSGERLWYSTFVLGSKPCLSAQITQQSYRLITIEKLPSPQEKLTLWSLWGFYSCGYFLLILEHRSLQYDTLHVDLSVTKHCPETRSHGSPIAVFFFFPSLILFSFNRLELEKNHACPHLWF